MKNEIENRTMKLTKRQKTVLEKIYKFMAENSYPPTVRDISRIFGFSSPRAAADHLQSLEKKGYIERNSLARSIRFTGKAAELLKSGKEPSGRYALTYYPGQSKINLVPLLGKIAAGNPLLAEENIEDYIPLPESTLGAYGADFALRVQGNSMTGDHILDGDIIMVKSRQSAENGEIIVALIEDEAVVKRFYRSREGVELRSSNPAYPSIKIKNHRDSRYFKIIGKVVAIHRSL
jgi:repressor LexA